MSEVQGREKSESEERNALDVLHDLIAVKSLNQLRGIGLSSGSNALVRQVSERRGGKQLEHRLWTVLGFVGNYEYPFMDGGGPEPSGGHSLGVADLAPSEFRSSQ